MLPSPQGSDEDWWVCDRENVRTKPKAMDGLKSSMIVESMWLAVWSEEKVNQRQASGYS